MVGDDEEAALSDRSAARDDGRLGVGGTLEETQHALLLLVRDDRAHLDLVVRRRIADGHRVDGAHGLRENVVVDPL